MGGSNALKKLWLRLEVDERSLLWALYIFQFFKIKNFSEITQKTITRRAGIITDIHILKGDFIGFDSQGLL